MKSSRHAKILEIINRQPIETQDELLEALSREGCKVTQATITLLLRPVVMRVR